MPHLVIVSAATAAICAVGGLALQSPGCAAGISEPVADSGDEWPSVLERGPSREAKHVHWLDVGQDARPRVVAIHPRGELVALQTSCETVVYDVRSGRRLHGWLLPTTVVQFSGDGQRLLTRRKAEFVLWNLERFQAIHRFKEQSESWGKDMPAERLAAARRDAPVAALSPVGSLVAVSNDRRQFAAERQEALLVYSDSGELKKALSMPEKTEVKSVQFVSQRRLLTLCSFVERAWQYVIWDAASGHRVVELPPGETVQVSADGRFVASVRLSRWQNLDRRQAPAVIRIWDVDSGALVQTVEPQARIRDFTFRTDGTRVLAALGDRLIEWDVGSGAVVHELQSSKHPFATVAYSPDGKRRYATIEIPNGLDDDVDHHLRGWDVSTGRSLAVADFAFASSNGTERLFFFPEGDRFIDLEATFAVRDIGTGKELQTAPTYRLPQREAAIMPDGRRFLAGSFLTDAKTGAQRRWTLPGAKHRFIDAGRTLFSGDHTGVFLTDVASGITFWKYLLRSPYMPTDVAASEDGERIVVAYRFGSKPPESCILVIDPQKPDQPRIIPEYASAVAVSPDHTRFVAASDRVISERATDIQTGAVQLWTPPGRVLFANYSPDGTKVIVGGATGHVDDWVALDEDGDGWAAVLDIVNKRVVTLAGHTAPVTTGVFGPDGLRCATGSLDRTVRLWSVLTGGAVHVFRGHLGPINRIAYGPFGKRILCAAKDGAAFWDIASNVDPDDQSESVAANFKQIASINAWSRSPVVRAGALEDPAKGTAEWSVVKLGNVDRVLNVPHDWLTFARSARQLGPYRRGGQPDAFAGYQFHGESRDGRRRLYSSRQKQEILVAEAGGELLATWKGYPRNNEVAISASGNEVAIARDLERGARRSERRYAVSVYDVSTGAARRTFDDVRSWYVHSLKIDPREETILLQIDNNDLELRDFLSGKRLAELKNGPAGALQSAYSLDGRFVVTCKSTDPVLHLRDSKTLRDVKPLTNYLPVRWFRLMPDGRHLLAGQPFVENRPLVTKWEIEAGRRVWTRAGPASVEGKFSNSGRYYLTKSGWYMWTLWDIETGRPCCVVVSERAHRPDGLAFVFSDDERSLYLGSLNGIRLWSRDD